MFSFFKRLFGTSQSRTLNRYRDIVAKINAIEESYQTLSDDELKAKTLEFKERVRQGEELDSILPEAFATVKSACKRLVGKEFHVSGYNQRWDMVPYDVQILGAIALFNGSIAEMQTGEGKTLTASMPLYLAALRGKTVHFVTANDYLVTRDCEWVGEVLRWLGLTTGIITHETGHNERREAYHKDIVYGTASEFGFDYLRDNSVATSVEEEVQRGHYYALIDEVDSILIDEARTPLIISGPSAQSRQLYDEIKDAVQQLIQRQKDECNALALESKKILEPFILKNGGNASDVKLSDGEDEAMRKLWLVSKGTPRNKILKRLREEPDIRASVDKWDLYYYSEQNKDEKAKALSSLHIIVDEKANEYELTDRGIHAWQECGGKEDDFVMLDLGGEFLYIDESASSEEEKREKKLKLQEEDAVRKERAHNLRQLLRAHLLMEKDVDYIVQDEKVVIIDENTGRPQPGRRFSDGLHQAIEAKEGAPIQRETQTYATITLQNYFRMYERLAGMTGTAITEANEFKEIYKIEVLQIPTYKDCIRKDANDEMYMTEREKYSAILKEIKTVHEQGRPILIGTESVEVSEKLSRLLSMQRLPHTVLNAKNNVKEAEIIAQAGQQGAITLSTNMAGRGTDIKLGAGIAAIGGLHVVGSTRHQSRRIDRQLRGRSGRLGDDGSSKFYISLEDQLMRLFSSPSLTSLLQRFRPPEGEPISASILNKSIETAQKRIEQQHYMVRKHTLEYDDVMNKQRREIYSFRHELIHSEVMMPLAHDVLENLCLRGAESYLVNREYEGGWDIDGFRAFLMHHLPITFEESLFDDDRKSAIEIAEIARDRAIAAFDDKVSFERSKAIIISRNPDFDPMPLLNNVVRSIMIRTIDFSWQEHLLAMDHLRSDVHLRVVGQKDPLMEFKHEAFLLFDKFTKHLREQIAQSLFKFELVSEQELHLEQLWGNMTLETSRSFATDLEAEDAEIVENEEDNGSTIQHVNFSQKSGRNDICPCGSGKKYKKCCGLQEEVLAERGPS